MYIGIERPLRTSYLCCVTENLKNEFETALNPGDLAEVMKSVTNFLLDGVFRSTLQFQIIYSNDCLLKMFGYSSIEEMQTAGVSLFADEASHKATTSVVEQQGVLVDCRVIFRKKDGKTFWGLLTGSKVRRGGNDVFEGVVHDISDRVKTEEYVNDLQTRFDKLSMELDQFVYSASHDIRSPISTALGLVNLMRLELKDETTEKYVSMLKQSLIKLENYAGELTGFGKNSKNRLDDERIDFGSMISEILSELSQTHPNFRSVTHSFDLVGNSIFYSDTVRMQLILRNVIKNCFDYFDRSKAVSVISTTVTLQPEKASIDVYDNGVGIPALYQRSVFDIFFRGTDLSKGPGLGLYCAREAAMKLGGTITLQSEYGIGTSVKIQLPNSRKGRLVNMKQALRQPN